MKFIKTQLRETPLFVWALLAAAGAFYLLLWTRYDVGYFNDDSLYILQSRSLLQGRYVALHTPGEPSVTAPLPGYPLWLAPFSAVLGTHWQLLKGLNVIVLLLSGFLFWRIGRGILSDFSSGTALGLFLFNPTTVHLSTAVMAEPLFLLLSFLIFQTLLRSKGEESSRQMVLWGMLLAWASIVRPEGLFLAMAVLGGFVFLRQWRKALFWGIPLLILQTALFARNAFVPHLTSGFWGFLSSSLPGGDALFHTLWRNGFEVWKSLVLEGLAGLSAEGWIPLGFGLSLTMLFFYGFFQLRKGPWPAHATLAMGFYPLLFFLGHVPWFSIQTRYFLPVLPFLLLGVLLPVPILFRGKKNLQSLMLVVLLVPVYIFQSGHAFRESIFRTGENQGLRDTFAWVGEHTPPTSRFLVFHSGSLFLHTGRQGMKPMSVGNREDLRLLLLEAGVTHALVTRGVRIVSTSETSQRHERFWREWPGWMRESPDWFEPLYSNAEEGTELFRVVQDPAFLRAYELYRQALPDLDAGRWAQARLPLAQSLEVFPSFSHALNALGVTWFFSGERPNEAEDLFKKAAALCPEFTAPARNLKLVEESRRSRGSP